MAEPRGTLTEVWRWLPVFRRVAELENVSSAARSLGLSAPAVSRALQKVEQAIGRELFDRRGRKLMLNPHGASLLAAVREAELNLEGAVTALVDGRPRGVVRLGAVGQLARAFLLPAVKVLGEEHPEVEISIVHLDPEEALRRLREGALDWFLALNVTVGEPLLATPLGRLELAIYAGRAHPLFLGAEPSLERLLSHGFVAQRRPGLMRSVWPTGQKRKITLQTDAHALALEACLAGSHLMVMERVIARPFVEDGQLRELPAPFLEAAQMSLIRNAQWVERPADREVGLAIRRVVQGALASISTAKAGPDQPRDGRRTSAQRPNRR